MINSQGVNENPEMTLTTDHPLSALHILRPVSPARKLWACKKRGCHEAVGQKNAFMAMTHDVDTLG